MYAHNSPSVSLQMAQVRSSENSCSTTLVNKGKTKRKAHHPGTAEEPRSRDSLSSQDRVEAPGARASEETPGARKCDVELSPPQGRPHPSNGVSLHLLTR